MTTPQHKQTCGSCAHWTRHGDERMADYGQCAQRPVGHYNHQGNACAFTQMQWKKKS